MVAMAGRTLISKLSSSSPLVSIGSFAARSLSGRIQLPLLRLRPLLCAAADRSRVLWPAAGSGGPRCFSTRSTTSSLNDPSPNWSNRPPKETILLDGCDFEHWLVVMEPPDPSLTRDEIIDSYIKTLAQVLGSEEEARMSIYSVSTKHYFAFGAKVSEEISYKIKPLPKVRWVLPDSYLDVKNKDYGGEPFIDGKAVPYDPKYHEEWVRNNARAQERSRRNDRPRNFDRSRNFERRRENMQFQNRDAPPLANQDFQNRDAQAMAPQRPPVPNMQNSVPPRENPPNATPPNPGVVNNYHNPTPSQQNNYVPNAGSGYQGPSYQGGPSAPGYQGGPGGPGYHGGPTGPNYQERPSGDGYQGGMGPSYQGGSQLYQGGNPANQGYNPGFQGGNPGFQGGNPGFQGGTPNYQPHNPSHWAQTAAPSYQTSYQPDAPGHQPGAPGYQGGSPSHQQFSSNKQAFQPRDMPGRD